MSQWKLRVGLVGAGPRGLSVLERICANERKSALAPRGVRPRRRPLPAGRRAVWRTGQSRELLMNTVASQVTVFTDDSVEMDGPVEPGPSLYEWARARRSAATAARTTSHTLAEAPRLGPDSYPTRAFYGHYLDWALPPRSSRTRPPTSPSRCTGRGPSPWTTTGTAAPAARRRLGLDDGILLTGLDAVVLAQGHVPAQLAPPRTDRLAASPPHGLTYVRPANPADVDLSGIAARPDRAAARPRA